MADQGTLPRVWALTGHKLGDKGQVLALAEALGWPFEVKSFAYRRTELITNLLCGPTLAGIVAARSSALGPPWPDLIITAGRRNEPVARWIQARAAEEGRAGDQRVRIVHLGRPWAPLDRFDLIVTTPQYKLPQRPNILHNETPLFRINRQRLEQEGARWRDRLAQLPRPLVALFIGGSSGAYVFDKAAAQRLAAQAQDLVGGLGGSLLVSTSARTPAATPEILAAGLTCPHSLYRWTAEAEDNPYFAYLALADQLIVTGDSMSMLTEACFTGKPVHIFDLGEGADAMRVGGGGRLRLLPRRWDRAHLKAHVNRLAIRLGPTRMIREIGWIHRQFIEAGAAVWLGDPFPAERSALSLDGLSRAVARVKELFTMAGDSGQG